MTAPDPADVEALCWSLCPQIRQWTDDESALPRRGLPVCKKCPPLIFPVPDRPGKQMCRLLGEQAAEIAIAALRARGWAPRVEAANEIYAGIEHGDEQHRKWLRDALDRWAAGEAIRAAAGSPRSTGGG